MTAGDTSMAGRRRAELQARCARERNELALMAASTMSRLHLRDVLRVVRLVRRLLRLFSR
jgi:hypothetical protein